MWNQSECGDLKLFVDRFKNWRKDFDMRLLETPFIIKMMYPDVARKLLNIVIAGEVNIDTRLIDSVKAGMKQTYTNIWIEGHIPILFYRTKSITMCKIKKSQLINNDEPIEILEYIPDITSYDSWEESIFMTIDQVNVTKFKAVIENSFVGYTHSANQAVEKIKDIKTRYMRLLDMIVCVGKFGPISECQDFSRSCYELDILQQDKTESHAWMPEEIILECHVRKHRNREE